MYKIRQRNASIVEPNLEIYLAQSMTDLVGRSRSLLCFSFRPFFFLPEENLRRL